MTKEITKAIVLQEMQDKLKLREFAPAKFLFDETVVPIYNIGQHFEEWWQQYTTLSITGTGPMRFFPLPEGEKWHVKRYDVVFMTGAFTIAGIYIQRKNRTPTGAFTYLDLGLAKNTSYHVETDVDLIHGDEIFVNVDGFTTPGNIRLYIDYKKEILR